jgi:hypothetical protein
VFTFALREQGNMNSHMAYVRMTVHRDKNVMSYCVSVSEQISTIPPTQLLLRIRSPPSINTSSSLPLLILMLSHRALGSAIQY